VLNGDLLPEGYLDLWQLEQNHRDKFCSLEIEDARRLPNSPEGHIYGAAGSLQNEFCEMMVEAAKKAPAELKNSYLRALFTGSSLLSGKDLS
jgi:hypothetical protein